MDNILSPEKLTHTWLEDTLALLFGTLMISFGIILFRQAGALTGGTAGMAFLIHYATHLPFGVVFFVINLPFYWLLRPADGRRLHAENLLRGRTGVPVL